MTVGVGASVAGSPGDVRAEVAELLGVSADTVDPDGNLISQGLDSIRMMALAGRWRRRGIAVDFAALAADPSVEAWSLLISASQDDPEKPAGADVAAAPTGTPDDAFPLAPMQHAMWVGRHDSQPLGGVAGHLYVEFDGAGIDPERLREAAADLAMRHPMLRVRFLSDGTQRIDPVRARLDFPITVHDFRDLADDVVGQRLTELREAKSHQQLDAQVLELTLSVLPGGSSRLHVDLDMQASDAMSYRTLMADLAKVYRGQQLPDLHYSYPEYRREIARRDAGPQPAHDADRDWWSQRIPELPDPPGLPSASRKGISRNSTRRWQWLDPRTRDALFAHARSRGVTPAMTFAAAFAHTLACWSRTARFLLNVPLFGREALHPDVDSLVGDFTSSLLLDINLTGTVDAASRAHAVQNAMRTAATHASYPGLSVLRDLGRHRGTAVLAPVVFTSALGLGELFCADVSEAFGTPGWIISQGPQVSLDAQVTEFDGGVLVNWDVREDVFPVGVVDAMFAHHLDELRRLASGGDAWTTPDPPALPAGQRAVRDAVNSRGVPYSAEALHDGFFRHAERHPDAPAVFASSGDLSYGQLRDQALRVAAALRTNGIGSGDTVAVMGPKTAEQVPALLGILAAGGIYLPIGVDQPADRAARILDTGAVRAVLVCGSQPMQASVPVLTVADALQRYLTAGTATSAVAQTDPAELAYVLFTSGSTGEPKGVEVTHDAAISTVESLTRHFEIGPDDRCLALSTLECDMSVLDIFGTLRAGGAIVVVDEAERRNPDAWARLIDTHSVTVLNFLPGWLEMLVEVGTAGLSSLRVVPTGGDWVRPELARLLRARAPQLRFAGLGGATETAVHATICEPSELPADWTAVPYGMPLPNIACRVVSDTGADCPDWVAGELWVSGRGIARGYRGRPDLTAQRFVEYDGRKWYRTGDLARYWPDGTLEFVGRADHRVKLSGYRVELGDVEAALRRIPGVAMAVAALVPTPGGTDMLAAAVRADNARLTSAGVLQAMTELVPAHMIPRQVAFVEQIPFTVGGKIDRPAVARELAVAAAAAEPDHRVPSTPLESALATIVGDVLGVATIGVDDDFFALGGDSVLATQTVARIRAWLDTPDVLVADIFATRTVFALTHLLGRRERDPGRLDQVAELYLEVIQMDAGNVVAAIAENEAVQ